MRCARRDGPRQQPVFRVLTEMRPDGVNGGKGRDARADGGLPSKKQNTPLLCHWRSGTLRLLQLAQVLPPSRLRKFEPPVRARDTSSTTIAGFTQAARGAAFAPTEDEPEVREGLAVRAFRLESILAVPNTKFLCKSYLGLRNVAIQGYCSLPDCPKTEAAHSPAPDPHQRQGQRQMSARHARSVPSSGGLLHRNETMWAPVDGAA